MTLPALSTWRKNRCDDTHSFNLSVNYNPWNLGENKKMKHILIQPEYRWWLNETFIGSFFGGASPFRPIQFRWNHSFHHGQEQPLSG